MQSRGITLAMVIIVLLQSLCAVQGRGAGKMSYDSPPPLPNRITATNQMTSKPELTIGVFVNYGGHTLPIGPACYAGVEIALDAIQKASLLADYELVIQAFDDNMGENGDVTKTTIGFLDSAAKNTSNNVVPLIVATLCSESLYIGQFLKQYNYVGLAEGTITLEHYTERRRYEDFFILIPSFETFYEAIPAFLRSQGWSRAFLLSETFSFWNSYEDLLQFNMKKANISLAGISKVITVSEGLPAPEHFQEAVHDLASLEPRIIIVNTHFGSLVACWLHHYGLYGPGYVYIFFGPAFFLPNSFLRTIGCTDEMLFQVLQSIIFFKFGTPISLYRDNAVDALGITGKYFDDQLKAKIDRPELNEKWFYWRPFCYSEVVAAALMLNYTEAKLKQRNDTLLNWVTKSDNFRRNGSYIQSIIRENLADFHYRGLNTHESARINSRTGIAGFFQMQVDPVVNLQGRQGLVEALQVVPVASYDSARKDGVITRGPGQVVWRTPGGHTPYDSMRIARLHEPIISVVAKGALFGVASALLCFTCVLAVLNVNKLKSETVSNSLPLLNMLIIVGNMFTLSFVLILPTEGNGSTNISCIAASLVIVLGFSLMSSAILAKMQAAAIVVSHDMTARQIHNSHRQHNTRTSTQVNQRTSGQPSMSQLYTVDQRLWKRAIPAVIIWSFIQFLLVVVWFGLEPPQIKVVNRRLEASESDLSLSYQHFTYACNLDVGTPTSQGFLITLLVCYLLVALRSIYLGFLLRKVSFTNINDLHLVRTASYTIAISVVAGGAVIWSFFSGDVGNLEIAVSSLAMIVVTLSTVLIFAPKLRSGYLF